MLSYKRTERVGDLIKGEIADIILRKIKDPRIGSITVTAVAVSEDLRHAKVFVSILGEGAGRRAGAGTSKEATEKEATEKATLAGLSSAAGFIRGELGKRLRLRYIPTLSFQRDRSLERAAVVYELMEGLKEENS